MKDLNWFQKWLLIKVSRMACEHKSIMDNGKCWNCGKFFVLKWVINRLEIGQ